MHGVVTDYVGYKGEPYKINLGVALHTIRSIAQSQERDSELAKILYQESARELKLAALWLAGSDEVSGEELDFWAEGLINTEICDEAAFALLRYVEGSEQLLYHPSEMVQYCALVTMSYLPGELIAEHLDRIVEVAAADSHHIAHGVVITLEQAARQRELLDQIKMAIEQIKPLPRGEYISEELEWRIFEE